MLLCDSAQSVGGKLFILGGGWSQALSPTGRISMALAVKMSIPWDMANHRLRVVADLVDDDHNAVTVEGEPVQAEGLIEVGRPPGLKHGTRLDSPFVLQFTEIPMPPGGYVWRLNVDDRLVATAPFRVLESAPGPV